MQAVCGLVHRSSKSSFAGSFVYITNCLHTCTKNQDWKKITISVQKKKSKTHRIIFLLLFLEKPIIVYNLELYLKSRASLNPCQRRSCTCKQVWVKFSWKRSFCWRLVHRSTFGIWVLSRKKAIALWCECTIVWANVWHNRAEQCICVTVRNNVWVPFHQKWELLRT